MSELLYWLPDWVNSDGWAGWRVTWMFSCLAGWRVTWMFSCLVERRVTEVAD